MRRGLTIDREQGFVVSLARFRSGPR
jgi:hypothetical protein